MSKDQPLPLCACTYRLGVLNKSMASIPTGGMAGLQDGLSWAFITLSSVNIANDRLDREMFRTAFDYWVVRFLSLPELHWGCQGCSSWEQLIPWHGPRASHPYHPLCQSWGVSLLPSILCNYWNQTTQSKHLSKQQRFGINQSFNLTASDPAPLAATSPLPSHPRSRCRVSEGNETCSLPCLVKKPV